MAAYAEEKLYDKIYTQLQQGKSISLDFTGVKIFTSTFLNIAIGQLLKNIVCEKLYELVEFTGLSQKHQKLLAYAIENANSYYK